MLQAETSGRQTCYCLLETIRQYGKDHLVRWTDASAIKEAHARYYLGLAERGFGDIFGQRFASSTMLGRGTRWVGSPGPSTVSGSSAVVCRRDAIG